MGTYVYKSTNTTAFTNAFFMGVFLYPNGESEDRGLHCLDYEDLRGKFVVFETDLIKD